MEFQKIPSFTVNHLVLLPGIYISRQDSLEGHLLTTFDVRMKAPNREPALSGQAAHTLEHLGATFLRNHPLWRDRTVYWGPMGCLTGFYLILKGDLKPMDILPLMQETYRFMSSYQGEIPGATPRDCGNYSYQDLPAARGEAASFLRVLENLGADRMVYPQ